MSTVIGTPHKQPFTVRTLAEPTAVERAGAETALALSMKSNPFLMMSINNNIVWAYPFARCVLDAGLRDGTVHIAEDVIGKIIGTSIWFGPGTEFLHTDLQKELFLKPLLACFDDKLREWWLKWIKDYGNLMDTSLGPDVLLGSWHWQLCGVLPENHRSGVAHQLFNAGKSLAKNSGTIVTGEPCAAVSNGLIPTHNMFMQMGFKTKGHRLFKSPDGTSEGQVWSMVLDPSGEDLKSEA